MKKILIMIATVVLFTPTLTFGEVIDDLKLLSKDDLASVNAKINEYEKRTSIRVIVVTEPYGKDYKTDRPEKTIVLNILKDVATGDVKIEAIFTRDLGMDEFQDDVDLLLDNLSEFSLKNDYKTYIEEFLFGVDDIILKNNIQVTEGMTVTEAMSNNKWKLILWLVAVLTFFNILTKIRRVSKEKKQKLLNREVRKR